jgi:hypothetical protein
MLRLFSRYTPLTTENSVAFRWGFLSAYEDLFSNAKHGTVGPLSIAFTTKAPQSIMRYGVEVQFSKITRELKENDSAYFEEMNTIGVMPHVDIIWLNTEYVKVSASAGLGIGMSFANSTVKGDRKFPMILFQFDVVRLKVGKEFFGTLDVGYGTRGLFSIGAGYNF